MRPAMITISASAAQAAGVKVSETGWFGRDNLPEELNFKPVSDAIFNGGLVGENGTPGSNSDIITVDGDRAFVLRISGHKAGSREAAGGCESAGYRYRKTHQS